MSALPPPGARTVLLTEEREAKLADAGRVVELKVGKGEIVTVELFGGGAAFARRHAELSDGIRQG